MGKSSGEYLTIFFFVPKTEKKKKSFIPWRKKVVFHIL